MKRKVILIVIIFVAAVITGFIIRGKYTKVDFGQEDALDNFTVYCQTESNFETYTKTIEVDDSLVEFETDLRTELIDAIDGADVIIRATCESGITSVCGLASQNVRVSEVYRGSDKIEGKTIQVISSEEQLRFGSMWDYQTELLSYVNFMEEGQEYLIFLNKTGNGKRYIQVSLLSYFSIDDVENEISDTGQVLYQTVKDNEFFVADQASLDIFLDMKEYAMATYMEE